MKQYLNKAMKLNEYIQPPNFLLSAGLVTIVLAWFMPDESRIEAVFSAFSYGLLFAWAWLEITKGTNWFRRLLGLVVFVALIAGTSMRFYN